MSVIVVLWFGRLGMDQISENGHIKELHARNSLPAASIVRSASIKEKKGKKGLYLSPPPFHAPPSPLFLLYAEGHRSRSNTTHLLPHWMRRKRGSGQRSSSPPSSRALQRHSADSIADMFQGYMRATNIAAQQDSLAMYMVSL